MKKKCLDHKKKLFTGKVVKNVSMGPAFYRLSLCLDSDGANAFSRVVPGQFAEICLSNTSLPAPENIPEELADTARRQIILRRPFSFCDVRTDLKDDPEHVCIDILYCVVGPATLRMTTLKEADSISLIGPLGNGFSIPNGKKHALLVAGGMGAPPLLHLAKILKNEHQGIAIVSMIGARTVNALPLGAEDFSRYASTQLVATDDASAGSGGFVTHHLEEWLRGNSNAVTDTIVYSCGPEPMLAETARLAAKYNVPCQVSMERLMACGIGLCQSCAVETKTVDKNETVYKLCCKDGPVFDSREVIFGTGNE